MPVAEQTRESKSVVLAEKRPNDRLSRCFYDQSIPTYTSQRGEDRVLQKLFEVIGVTNEWCVEFGAMGGKRFANTWYWIEKQGWKSVQIEAARDWHLNLRTAGRESFDALQKRFRKSRHVTCVNDWVDVEGEHSLDSILAKTALPSEFDLLSIDVDSTDYAIWESFMNYRPRVVIIEHNKTIPIDVSFHSNRGSSLRAMYDLGHAKGYELVAANDLNGIFVDKDLYPLLGIKSNDPREIWLGQEQYKMFLEVSEGGVAFRGPDKLRWVRGLDGTLTGQLRAGKYKKVSTGDHTVSVKAPDGLQVHASGVVRYLWHWLRG